MSDKYDLNVHDTDLVQSDLHRSIYMQWRIQGGLGSLTPLRFFFACQYMKIPAAPPPLEEFRPRTPPPPPEGFVGPLLIYKGVWALCLETIPYNCAINQTDIKWYIEVVTEYAHQNGHLYILEICIDFTHCISYTEAPIERIAWNTPHNIHPTPRANCAGQL